MAVKQVELRRGDLSFVAHEHIRAAPGKGACVNAALGEKVPAVVAEVIVHGGVEHVAAEPVPGAAPDFAYEQRVALDRLAAAAELAPEAVVRLVGHVEPPAIDVKFAQPVLADGAEVVAHFGVRRVQLRHQPLVAEAFVIRPLPGFGVYDGKPQAVKPACIAALFLLFEHVAEGEKLRAAVVEHPVEYDAQPARVALVHKGAEVPVRAEAGVDVQIVYRVVLVILTCGEDGIQVNAVGAERGYVIEILAYSVYCTAEARARKSAADALFRPATDDGAPGACKAVREDVVHHGV